MTKRIGISITAVFLCMLTLFVSSVGTAFAATSGGSGSATIYVTTKARYYYPGSSSITLKQEKQTMTFKKLGGSKTKTKKDYYGCYNISVRNVTKNDTDNVSWMGGKTKKIKLDGNCDYQITVRYDSTATDIFKGAGSPPWGYSWKSTSSPSWKVSGTHKVTSYY